MANELREKLFDFAERKKMNHGTLAVCLTVMTGVKTSRSTVAAWARGARKIGAARAAVIRDKMAL